MRLLLGLLGYAAAGFPPDLGPRSSCPTVALHKEVSEMEAGEWERFVRVYLRLQRLPPPDGHSDLTSEWDWWTSVHVTEAMGNHGTASFLPWHRLYTQALARRLQQLDESVVLPWWDFSRHWQRPLQSPLIAETALGLAVRPGEPGDCDYRRSLYQSHCLLRDYDPQTFTSWYSPAVMAWMVENNRGDYDGFRRALESGPHNLVHSSLGGPDGDLSMMISPNDPLFFPFHAAVDRFWWLWQQQAPENARAYGGNRFDGLPAQLSDELSPFGLTVEQTLNASALCYTYSMPSNPTPPILLELGPKLLKLPEPVPAWYLARHGYNETEVRQVERLLCRIMRGDV